jgi:hypothetical protein
MVVNGCLISLKVAILICFQTNRGKSNRSGLRDDDNLGPGDCIWLPAGGGADGPSLSTEDPLPRRLSKLKSTGQLEEGSRSVVAKRYLAQPACGRGTSCPIWKLTPLSTWCLALASSVDVRCSRGELPSIPANRPRSGFCSNQTVFHDKRMQHHTATTRRLDSSPS